MKSLPLTLFIVATATLCGLYAWVRVRSEFPSGDPVTIIIEAPTTHLVTPEMAKASRAMLDRPAPGFSKPATDGQTHRLDEMLKQGPVLLTFIKKGCPCSEAAQSFFNELHAAYPKVSMWGVIDQDAASAQKWAESYRVAYPMLLDPGEELVRSYGIENSGYVVLINPHGEISKHWPGFSDPMLRELGSLLAELSGSPEVSLDLADAPSELYTGCPYEIEVDTK